MQETTESPTEALKTYTSSISPTKLSHDEAPQIYVACLAAYNNGKLHGRWIDCTFGPDHIWDEIKTILESSPEHNKPYPCEEWAIHDYQYFPQGLISEYSGISQVSQFAEILEKDDGEAILELHSYLGNSDIDSTLEYHENNYCGCWDSFKEYSDDYLESSGMLSEMPEFAQRYFDFESFANDLEHDYIVISEKGGCFVWHHS